VRNAVLLKVIHGEIGQMMHMRRIAPRSSAREVRSVNGDQGAIDAYTVQLLEESRKVMNVFDDVIQEDFISRIVIKR
jgi:hypothetical protein